MADQRRDIGQFIREQRKLAQLSVRKLADRAGMSNPYLSQIERGLRKPSAGILQQLAKALELSAETMYVQAGMLDAEAAPETMTLPAAIRAASELSGEQRQALLSVYWSFVRPVGAPTPEGEPGPVAERLIGVDVRLEGVPGPSAGGGAGLGVDPVGESRESGDRAAG